MTMTAHTYYTIFGRPPIWGEASPLPPGGATVTGPNLLLFNTFVLLEGVQLADNNCYTGHNCRRVIPVWTFM